MTYGFYNKCLLQELEGKNEEIKNLNIVTQQKRKEQEKCKIKYPNLNIHNARNII